MFNMYIDIHVATVALKYTLSRFEVGGDSTELSSVQQLRPAQLNWAQLRWTQLSWITHNLEPTKCVPQGHRT